MKLQHCLDAIVILRDKLYDDLQDRFHGEKLPCDLNTTEGVLVRRNEKITRILLLRLIRQKDLLVETKNKAVNKYLFPILERYKHLDFSDVPFWKKITARSKVQ